MAYFFLFITSLLAATLLPMYSEAAVLALLQQGFDPFLTWASATSGNTSGACINWLIGRYLLHFSERKWFPVSAAALARSQNWFQHYGSWIVVFAWLPVVGDPLTMIAGILRMRFVWFFLLVAAGKGARYALLVWASSLMDA